MTNADKGGAPPSGGALDGEAHDRAGSGSGATVNETGRSAFSFRPTAAAMPATPPEPARSAAEEAANGGWHDHDRGTRWEGLIDQLPRFRAAPIAAPTHSGRADRLPHKATPAIEKAKRRNERKARRGNPSARAGHRGGMAGLLAALRDSEVRS